MVVDTSWFEDEFYQMGGGGVGSLEEQNPPREDLRRTIFNAWPGGIRLRGYMRSTAAPLPLSTREG